MIGLLCLGTTILLAESDSVPAWWLLPLGWIWINSHGSWPIGIGYLVVRLIGRRIDHGDTTRLWQLLRWAVAGACVGAIGPVGPKLLTFPFHLLSRHTILSHVVEWQSPSFSSIPNLVFLGAALVAIALASRGGWEEVLPSVVFVAMAITAARNVSIASLVLLPVAARHFPAISPTRRERPSKSATVVVAALVVFGVAMTARVVAQPAYDLRAYPVAELSWMRDHVLLDGRVAAPDFVGNYRTWAEGAHAQVFIDDRYDMYPPSITQSTFTLDGLPGWDAVLDHFKIDVVLWPRHNPLSQLLARDSRWVIVHQSTGWVVAMRLNSTKP
jgi:hypothetical protein